MKKLIRKENIGKSEHAIGAELTRATFHRLCNLVVACFLMLAGLAAGHAQTSTADLLGTVTDSSGAVINNATVTIVNLATKDRKASVSNDSGGYLFPTLSPGHYSVTVSEQGFKTFNTADVNLSAGDRVRVDAYLSLGAATETVEVKSAPPQLQTDSSVVGNTLTEQAVQDLPLNGRNFINLVQLSPGASEGSQASVGTGAAPDDRRQSSAISVNGQADLVNDNLVDGLDNNERLIGVIGVRPSIDAIQEVHVSTNTFTADSGRAAGAVINVITKSGGNQLHGSAYEYLRNDVLNAFSFQFGAHNPKPKLRQNQFGGSLGGPIWKDRTFFFGDAELFRVIRGSAPASYVVPTLFEQQHPGNFSDNIPATCATAIAAGGGPNPSAQTSGCVYDQVTGAVIPSNIIPTAQLDKVGLLYMRLYPNPNVGLSGFVGSRVSTQYSTTYDIRIDHKISSKDNIFARYTVNDVSTFTAPPALPITSAAMGIPLDPQSGFGGQSPELARSVQVNYSHTFTPNLLLTLGAGYSYINILSLPVNYGVNPNTAFGQSGVNFSQATSGLAPIVVTGGTNLGAGDRFVPLQYKDNNYQLNGAVYYTLGQHSLKAGAALIRRQAYDLQDSAGEGYWTFQDGYPGLASGFFSSVTRINDLYPPHYRSWEPSGFVQDDWRATHKLTLNLGARYDVFTPVTEITNKLSNFDPNTATIDVAGAPGVSRSANVQIDYSNFAPRVGFAYTAFPGTVVRGGLGLAFYPGGALSNIALKNQPNVVTYGVCSSISNGNGCNSAYNRFATGVPLPVAPTSLVLTGSIPSSIAFGFRSSYLEQFNLTVQQSIAQNVITIAYVGALGRHIVNPNPDINRAPLNTANPGVAAPRRFAAQLPNVSTIGNVSSQGASSYHSLQATLDRRFANGLSYNFNTTWAHNMDNVGQLDTGTAGVGQVLATAHIDDYGNSDIQQRKRFVASITYAVPYGKNLHGVAGIAAKGWHANVLDVWATGVPFTILNSSNVSLTNPNGGADRPNMIGSATLSSPTIKQFFNTAAFAKQAPSTLGSERKDQLDGPHFRHTDVSVFKDVPVFREASLQFRAEVFNVLNQTNLGTPGVTLGSSTFGQITSTNLYYTPRLVQFALRLQF